MGRGGLGKLALCVRICICVVFETSEFTLIINIITRGNRRLGNAFEIHVKREIHVYMLPVVLDCSH